MTEPVEVTEQLTEAAEAVAACVAAYDDELVAMRRTLHAHPELGYREVRTTGLLRDRLVAAGLAPRGLPRGTGLVCDIGPEVEIGPEVPTLRTVALRADLDALPVPEQTSSPFRSLVDGVSHACGHDVHTAVVLGAGLALTDLHRRGLLAGRVRLLFQPAEELMPGGALEVVAAGGLDGVERVLAVHCDPRTDVGRVGLRVGPVTAASDRLLVRLHGRGGHTARPHLTGDLVFALGRVVTEVPALLSRRVDPRAGLSLVWGRVAAGSAANAIPEVGEVEGTVRCLGALAWEQAPTLLAALVEAVVAPLGVRAEVDYRRGVPPVVNDAVTTAALTRAATRVVGAAGIETAEQSLGGEDFAWYLAHVPGSLARLGVRTPGDRDGHDLHQGSFTADERAIGIGARLLAVAAVEALREA